MNGGSSLPIATDTYIGVSRPATLAELTAKTKFDPVTGARLFAPCDLYGIVSTGISSINADTAAAQTLAVGSTGTDFAIVDGGAGAHTLNLPTASATNTGKLSKTDWSTFNGKQAGDATLTALAALDATAGMLVETAADTFTKRTLAGTSGKISVSNGDGVLGNPTVTVGADIVDATASYADPAWITSLAGSKVSGNIPGNAANVTGTVAIGSGGTGATTKTAAFDALSPESTKGDIIVHNGTNNIRVGVGANNQVLTADSAQASGVKWATPATSTITVTAKTGDYTVLASDSNTLFTNEGAAGAVIFTLPAVAAGLIFMFFVRAVQTLRLVVNGVNTIFFFPQPLPAFGASAGSVASLAQIETGDQGSFIKIIGINASEWCVESSIGSWFGK